MGRTLLLVLLLLGSAPAHCQAPTAAVDVARWGVPAPPFRIAGPISYVGTVGLGAFLIETRIGLILLNTGTQTSGPAIAHSMKTLGFALSELRFILVSHAHFDHVGGHAWLARRSKAEVVALDVEAPLLASGGRSDFAYGKLPPFRFGAVKADRLLKDGEALEFGGIRLVAHLTPGHTQGTTSWTMTIVHEGTELLVAFPDGTSVNSGYRLGAGPSYPGIAADYAKTFERLGALRPDIWLTSHPEFSGLWEKKARADREGVRAWIDRPGYARFIAERKASFERSLAAAAPQ